MGMPRHPSNCENITQAVMRAYAALLKLYERHRGAITLAELTREMAPHAKNERGAWHFHLYTRLCDLGLAERAGGWGIVPRYRFIPIDRLEESNGE